MKRLPIALVSALALAACQDSSSSSPTAGESSVTDSGFVGNTLDDIIFDKPGDGRFKGFKFSQGGGYPVLVMGGTADNGFRELQMSDMGHYTAIRGNSLCDSVGKCTYFNDTVTGVLDGAALDSALLLFADTAVYNSVPLVPSQFICDDAPWWKASVDYSDGHDATFDKPEEICSGLPDSYVRVSAFAWKVISGAFAGKQ